MQHMRDPLAEARALFSPAQGSIYLDAATYGLPPRPTVEAMQRGLAAWQAGTADWIHDWDERGEDCRATFATLIGAQPREIALVPTGSVGVATVAASLTAADSVLLADDEFTSVVYPLMVAAQDRGARIRSVKFDQLAENIEAGTTLVAFSLIQSQSGRGAALNPILEACRHMGARTLVDATHAVPFVPLQAHIESIDYLVCAAYKHLLCPRGVGLSVCAPQALGQDPARAGQLAQLEQAVRQLLRAAPRPGGGRRPLRRLTRMAGVGWRAGIAARCWSSGGAAERSSLRAASRAGWRASSACQNRSAPS